MLIDQFARDINYVRISVTDRCDFRCSYCMAENMSFLPKKELLSLEELSLLCNVLAERGIKKIRITGGEPLVRRNVIYLFENLRLLLEQGKLTEVTLTTNASQLEHFADSLYHNGVRR